MKLWNELLISIDDTVATCTIIKDYCHEFNSWHTNFFFRSSSRFFPFNFHVFFRFNELQFNVEPGNDIRCGHQFIQLHADNDKNDICVSIVCDMTWRFDLLYSLHSLVRWAIKNERTKQKSQFKLLNSNTMADYSGMWFNGKKHQILNFILARATQEDFNIIPNFQVMTSIFHEIAIKIK